MRIVIGQSLSGNKASRTNLIHRLKEMADKYDGGIRDLLKMAAAEIRDMMEEGDEGRKKLLIDALKKAGVDHAEECVTDDGQLNMRRLRA